MENIFHIKENTLFGVTVIFKLLFALTQHLTADSPVKNQNIVCKSFEPFIFLATGDTTSFISQSYAAPVTKIARLMFFMETKLTYFYLFYNSKS